MSTQVASLLLQSAFQTSKEALSDSQDLEESKYLVAVYGSLKSGFGNHRIIKGSKYLGPGITENKYTMLSLGSYPLVNKYPSAYVRIELYEVDKSTLQSLDNLEGHPTFYKRELIDVSIFLDGLGSEVVKNVWLYFIADEGRYHDYPEVKLDRFSCYNWTKD